MNLSDIAPQKRYFLFEYLSNNFNATKAAITAGYSKESAKTRGSEILKEPAVAAALTRLVEERCTRMQITGDWVLGEAVSLYQRLTQAEKVLDRDGNHTGEYRFDATNALKALALIGKHVDVRAFENKPDHSDSDLIQRLQRGRIRALESRTPPVEEDLPGDEVLDVSFMDSPEDEPPGDDPYEDSKGVFEVEESPEDTLKALMHRWKPHTLEHM